MCELFRFFDIHQLGEHATHPIARFPACRALLLRLAWNSHAALSRLQGAFVLAWADRFAGSQHAARNPCSTLARQPKKTHTQARPTAESRLNVCQNFSYKILKFSRQGPICLSEGLGNLFIVPKELEVVWLKQQYHLNQ